MPLKTKKVPAIKITDENIVINLASTELNDDWLRALRMRGQSEQDDPQGKRSVRELKEMNETQMIEVIGGN